MGRRHDIDLIKGAMLLIVLLDHCALNAGVIIWNDGNISTVVSRMFAYMSFFMAPFFFISGYLDNNKGHGVESIKLNAKKLLWPYFTFHVLGVVVCLLADGKVASNTVLNSLLHYLSTPYNTPLWFLISLFIIKSWFAIRIPVDRFAMSIAFLSLAFLISGRNIGFSIGNILLGAFFYGIGETFRRYENYFTKGHSFAFAMLFVTIMIFAPQKLVFVSNTVALGNYYVAILYDLLACILLMLFAKKILQKFTNSCKPICYIGRNSLVIFAFHRPLLNFIISPLLADTNLYAHNKLFIMIFSFILLIFVMVIVDFVLRRYAKWIIQFPARAQ